MYEKPQMGKSVETEVNEWVLRAGQGGEWGTTPNGYTVSGVIQVPRVDDSSDSVNILKTNESYR